MNLDRIDEAWDLMDRLGRRQDQLDRLEASGVYSILFTDGSQKTNVIDVNDERGPVVLELFPDSGYGDLGHLAQMIVENTKKVIRAEIDKIKAELEKI